MTNDKNRTGEVWKVKYAKIPGSRSPINKKRTYVFKIVRSWKCSKLCGDHYQYKGLIVKASDPKDQVGSVCYLGHLFTNQYATCEQVIT